MYTTRNVWTLNTEHMCEIRDIHCPPIYPLLLPCPSLPLLVYRSHSPLIPPPLLSSTPLLSSPHLSSSLLFLALIISLSSLLASTLLFLALIIPLSSPLLSSSLHWSSHSPLLPSSPPSSPLFSSIILSSLFYSSFSSHSPLHSPSLFLSLLTARPLRVAELQHKKEGYSVITIQRVYRGFVNRKKFSDFITERKTYYTIRLLENEIRDTFLYGFLDFFGFAPILISDTPCERVFKQYPKYAHAVISGNNRPNLVIYLR